MTEKKSLLERWFGWLFPSYFNKGAKWERHIKKKLKRMGERYVLSNLYIPRGENRWTEVDLVFICAYGVFAVECKNYGGLILGKEQERYWTQRFPNGQTNSFYSPVMQNKGHINGLKRHLQEKDASLFQSLVLFSDRCTLQVGKPIASELWLYQEAGLKKGRKAWRRHLPKVLSSKEQRRIYKVLKSCTHASRKVKKQHIKSVEEVQKRAKENREKAMAQKAKTGNKGKKKTTSRAKKRSLLAPKKKKKK